mmetsp:Transcript_2206/g.3479  ORF Transcript_2206/g.3479 Transcript_2206/m.3479 type:complete len:395 (+) Transcript_2206:39-1223(+)
MMGLSALLQHVALAASLGLTTRLDFLQGAATCVFVSQNSDAVLAPEQQQTSLLLASSSDVVSSTRTRTSSIINSSQQQVENLRQMEGAATRIRSQISTILDRDPKLAGPLLRLAFHDATTISSTRNNGDDGPNASIQYELDRPENRGLSVPLQVVLTVQRQAQNAAATKNNDEEGESPIQQAAAIAALSLADIIVLAGSEAVHHAGGPLIAVRLGRRDASQADPERVKSKRLLIRRGTFSKREVLDKTLPSAGLNSDGLRQYFTTRLGLSEAEFVALSGSHGMGRHVSLLGMSKACLKNLTKTCLEEAPVLLPFVASSVDRFDNSYFRYLQKWNARDVNQGDVAFLPTDVALIIDAGLRRQVDRFAQDEAAYFDAFERAYQKLVERTATTKERY